MALLVLVILCIISTSRGCEYTIRFNVSTYSNVGQHINSDGFPTREYNNDVEECWTITNIDNGTLRILFSDFFTEECCDFVTVYDGDNTDEKNILGNVSGRISNNNPRKYQTYGKSFHIVFKTDLTIAKWGWQACICPVENTVCGCTWDTLISSTTASPWTDWNSWNSWNSWDSWDGGNTWSSWPESESSSSTGLLAAIIGGSIASFSVILCIIIGVCCACCRSGSSTTNNVAMTTINTTNVPPGAYPVQRGVARTGQLPAGEPGLQQGVMQAQSNGQSQNIPDPTAPPAYDAAMTYPSPNRVTDIGIDAQTSYPAQSPYPPGYATGNTPSAPLVTGYPAPRDVPTNNTPGGSSLEPSSSNQETVPPPPSYDSVVS